MSDTLITVVAIVLAAGLIFVVPLMTMADRLDATSQAQVESIVSDFVDEIRSTGKITQEKYDKFTQNLTATGYTFDVAMEAKILDENPGKKTLQTTKDKIGENVYYSVYNTQIINNTIDPQNSSIQPKTYYLKEGDIISVSVKNANQTMAQQLKNFFYTVVGKDTYVISASHSGIVTVTGK